MNEISARDKKELINLVSDLLTPNISVACITCGQVFLNIPYGEYIALLNNDYFTPTKWYNKVVLHFCDNPSHEILSNKHPSGLTQQFDFTHTFIRQLSDNGITINDLRNVALIEQQKVENLIV